MGRGNNVEPNFEAFFQDKNLSYFWISCNKQSLARIWSRKCSLALTCCCLATTSFFFVGRPHFSQSAFIHKFFLHLHAVCSLCVSKWFLAKIISYCVLITRQIHRAGFIREKIVLNDMINAKNLHCYFFQKKYCASSEGFLLSHFIKYKPFISEHNASIFQM